MADISFAPFVAALEPIVVQVSAVIVAAGISWAAARFARATHVTVQQAALDKLTKAAQAEAGALIAAAGDNLATEKIAVGSPTVAEIANRIVRGMPEALVVAGVTPTHVATMVAGKIGELQARMTSVTPPLPDKPQPS